MTSEEPRSRRLSLSQSAAVWALVDVLLAVLALVTIPILFHRLGDERYGILGLVTVLTAQVAPLHFGIGPATTRRVAEWRGMGGQAGMTARAALLLSFVSALVAGGLSVLLAPWAWRSGFRLSHAATQEALGAVPLMVAIIALQPFLGNGMAVLAGRESFGLLGGIRILHGVLRQGLAVIAVVVGGGFGAALAAFAFVDFLSAVAVWGVVKPDRWTPPAPVLKRELRVLVALGAPTALAGVFGTVLADVEKLAVGVVRSVEEFAYYATPANALARLTVIPAAIAGVLMPRAAAMATAGEWVGLDRLVSLAARMSVAATLCLALPLSALLPELLSLWLGRDFSDRSALLSRIVLIGVVAQVGAFAAHAVLRARASPNALAFLWAAELVVQLFLVFVCVRFLGISGAAVAYTLKCVVDAAAQRWLMTRLVGLRSENKVLIWGSVCATTALTIAFTVVAISWPLRLAMSACLAVVLASRLVSPTELVSQTRSLVSGSQSSR